MVKVEIWKSKDNAPSNTNALWLSGNELLKFGNNGWESIFKKENIEEVIKLATNSTAGLVKQATTESQLKKDATLSDVINKLNAVIVKLQAAGIMSNSNDKKI